jgi:hypothetical protein
MAIAICSILAQKISTTEKSKLFKNTLFINKLKDFVENRNKIFLDCDLILNFALKLLKNIDGSIHQIFENIHQKSKNDENQSLMSVQKQTLNNLKQMKNELGIENFSEGVQNNNEEEIEKNLLIIKEESLIIDSFNKDREDSKAILKNLNRLYNYLLIHCEPRNDLIDLIISLMQKHLNSIDIILSSTACLYRLTTNKFAEKIDKNLIQKVFEMTLLAMEPNKDHQQLHINGLSIFVNEIILQDITFDRYKCVEIALNSIQNFEDERITQKAIWICSVLSTKLTIDEKLHLFSKTIYMEILIDIVKRCAQLPPDYDFKLNHTLSYLWNLTDRSSELCQIFLNKDGLNAYLLILNASFDDLELKLR